MSETLESRIRGWPGLGVLSRFDDTTGTWIFIALHDRTLGHPVGGTRLRHYARPSDGLLDAMRLAEGMTHKWAALDFDNGGGKAVLAVPGPVDGEARRGLFHRYGEMIEMLQGGFATGRDLGTTDEDMLALAEVTQHVHGVKPDGSTRDPGPYTAIGVFAAARASLRQLDGTEELDGRSVLVQGLGGVGEPLARKLAGSGARVLISDVDQRRAAVLAEELGATVVPPADVYDTECDLYAPCAIGGTLNEDTISRLRCRGVVGSANNQLAEPADADRLHARGILYAPDFVANAGGALAFGLIYRGQRDETVLASRVEGIAASLSEIFEEAAQTGESPCRAALRRVERRLRG